MTDALARLLNGVIDYAGLYPPAKLPMAEALSNYLSYRSGPEAWIVDRFVCGAGRLEELRGELDQLSGTEPIPITVVGTAADRDGWGDALVQDAQSMTRFIERVGEKADIEAYEIRVPDHAHLSEYLMDLRSFNQVDVYCELAWSPEMGDSLGVLAEQDWLGAKARTGGIEASAFPSSNDLAAFLQQCVQLEVAHKLTAGLHHPFRHHNDSVSSKMHGFLNVLAASCLLHAHDLSVKEVASVLDCEDASIFNFGNGQVQFGEWTATVDDIEDARDLFVSIGSCSVREPIEDLQTHRLI